MYQTSRVHSLPEPTPPAVGGVSFFREGLRVTSGMAASHVAQQPSEQPVERVGKVALVRLVVRGRAP